MSLDHHSVPDHRLERLMFFSDAVFAIAITLLVIELHVPALPPSAGNVAWANALLHMLPEFVGFAVSFLVVGAFWAAHHTLLSLVAGFDQRLVWTNLLMLLCIAFLPFATGLLTASAPVAVPSALYAGTLFVAALLKLRLTYLAMQPRLIAPGVSAARVDVERRRGWVMPLATGATLLLAFVIPGWNALAMLLVPVLRRLGPMALRPGDEFAPTAAATAGPAAPPEIDVDVAAPTEPARPAG